MKFEDSSRAGNDSRLGAVLALVMLSAFAFLVFGGGFDHEYATFGALVALPFCLGALITLSAHSYSPLGCLVAPVGLGLISAALVALGLEGFVCVAMVMPVWFAAGLGGGLIALYRVSQCEDRGVKSSKGTRLNSVGLTIVPFLLIYAESLGPSPWESREVSRSIVIDAPPEEVWPLTVSIPDVGPQEGKANFTHDWLAIPRPSAARLVERDGVAVREASWGKDIRFDEVLTETLPVRSMAWRFSFPDASLQNHTDRHISPDGDMLKIVSGRYDIELLVDNRSRVTLTTTYRMRTRLGWYFGWWGERLLGDIQDNVLAVVAGRAGSRA